MRCCFYDTCGASHWATCTADADFLVQHRDDQHATELPACERHADENRRRFRIVRRVRG